MDVPVVVRGTIREPTAQTTNATPTPHFVILAGQSGDCAGGGAAAQVWSGLVSCTGAGVEREHHFNRENCETHSDTPVS